MLALVLIALTQSPTTPETPVSEAVLALRDEAARLSGLVEHPAAHAILEAVVLLPSPAPKRVYYSAAAGATETFDEAEFAALDESRQQSLRALDVDARRFYYTYYGSPLASIRAFDVVAGHGFDTLDRKRVLDFGFGSIGQLYLLAGCGAEVVGVEVMPQLRAMYAGRSSGDVAAPDGKRGSYRMLFGAWPAEKPIADAAGAGFHLILSKNTLKRGYVAPPVEVAPNARIDLGVSNGEFLERVRAALAPGGLFAIYNIGGKPPADGEPYRSPTDIASPWTREQFSEAGFEILVLDQDDSVAIREYGAALGWNTGARPMQLDTELFARFTIARRPR